MNQTLVNNRDELARWALRSIQVAVKNDQKVIPIDAHVYFTKGVPRKLSGALFRDAELEKEVLSWLHSRVDFNAVMKRYQSYDRSLSSLEWPSHYATRFINLSSKASNDENIFMFFPEVLGLKTGKVEDYFGFEFIDVWVSVFDEIVFPCMRRVFDNETQFVLYTALRPVLEKTIYLASVFHEIGHRCGYWKVSPVVDERIHINQFHLDVLGELSTDSLLSSFLLEFTEIQYFVFLHRIFWFGRFGFGKNLLSGNLNEDNDTWIGSYLWNQYINHGVLKKNKNDTWHINFDKLHALFECVVRDVDSLGDLCVNNLVNQDELIDSWMQSRVEFASGKFCYPDTMREIFTKCVEINEKPVHKY